MSMAYGHPNNLPMSIYAAPGTGTGTGVPGLGPTTGMENGHNV